MLANEAAAELFGLPARELSGRPLSGLPVDVLDARGQLVADQQLALIRALRGEEVTGDLVRLVRGDGSLLWVEMHANPLTDDDGEIYGAVATCEDVTARVEQDRRTRHEAETDALTGLANRRALERTLEAALGRARTRVALGRDHHARPRRLQGDQRHPRPRGGRRRADRGRAAVARVRARARPGGAPRRRRVRGRADRRRRVLGAVRDTVDRIRDALAEPFAVDGTPMELRAAIGVASYPEDGGTTAPPCWPTRTAGCTRIRARATARLR